MIVYTGKQYWNDFNNWDEGLFQDANRPRDDDKFKIKPWLQSEKMNFRQSTKNISTRTSELIATATISILSWTEYKYPDKLTQKEKIWDPWCIINDGWDIEIVEDWTYIIQASCQFKFSTAPVNWYLYIEDMALLRYNDWGWLSQARTQGRACANNSNHIDQLSVLYTWWITKGGIFTVWAFHNYWGGNYITINQSISIQRLA